MQGSSTRRVDEIRLLINDSYTPRTLLACCSQSELTILKVRERSACIILNKALFLKISTKKCQKSDFFTKIDFFGTFWVKIFKNKA